MKTLFTALIMCIIYGVPIIVIIYVLYNAYIAIQTTFTWLQ